MQRRINNAVVIVWMARLFVRSARGRRWRGTAAVLLLLTCIGLPSIAAAQNILANPGFENNPPPNNGNNYPYPFTPWVLGTGDVSNVVKVDGPGGFNYGSAGPESDASNNGTGAGAGVAQHYADIVGTNDFYQSFVVPSCGAAPGQQRTATFSGWFSRRDSDAGSGTITIRSGTGPSGTALASASASIAANESINTWRKASGTVTVASGATVSFVVNMTNPTNFDEAFLSFNGVTCVSAPLTLRKTWSNASINDTASVTATRNGTQIDSLASVANTASETDTDTTPVTVFQGEQIVLAETLGAGNAFTYASALDCTGGGTLSGSTLTVNNTGDPITCTYANTGQAADLRVAKTNTPAAGPNDQAADTVTSGAATTYTIVVTNGGVIPVTGALVTDPAAGRANITCPAGNTVTCAGSAAGVCPGATTTIGTLSNPGYTLGTLPAGGTATLVFSCTVN